MLLLVLLLFIVSCTSLQGELVNEGDNQTFAGGVQIQVEEILFQLYEGGTQGVVFRVE
jgi:hypothetical protein